MSSLLKDFVIIATLCLSLAAAVCNSEADESCAAKVEDAVSMLQVKQDLNIGQQLNIGSITQRMEALTHLDDSSSIEQRAQALSQLDDAFTRFRDFARQGEQRLGIPPMEAIPAEMKQTAAEKSESELRSEKENKAEALEKEVEDEFNKRAAASKKEKASMLEVKQEVVDEQVAPAAAAVVPGLGVQAPPETSIEAMKARMEGLDRLNEKFEELKDMSHQFEDKMGIPPITEVKLAKPEHASQQMESEGATADPTLLTGVSPLRTDDSVDVSPDSPLRHEPQEVSTEPSDLGSDDSQDSQAPIGVGAAPPTAVGNMPVNPAVPVVPYAPFFPPYYGYGYAGYPYAWR